MKSLIKLTFFFTIGISSNLFSQVLTEISYTKPFLDSKNLGEMSSPNLAEISFGWAGNGYKPYGAVSIGYIHMSDNKVNTANVNYIYQSLMIGGKIGIRPFANKWKSRFQPIIQVGYKTTVPIGSEDEKTKQVTQLFSNGVTNIYDPTKITFLTGSLGAEFYITQRCAIFALGNYDYVIINENKLNNYSASFGLRCFIRR
jgi:hypothetical protein